MVTADEVVRVWQCSIPVFVLVHIQSEVPPCGTSHTPLKVGWIPGEFLACKFTHASEISLEVYQFMPHCAINSWKSLTFSPIRQCCGKLAGEREFCQKCRYVCIYLEDLLVMRAAADGGGGLSGLVGVVCRCSSVGVEGGGWEEWANPEETLLLEEAFLWWLRSVRLEQREWAVL